MGRLLLACLALALARGARTEELFAARLGPENLEALRPRGIAASAGLGDWALGNGTLCAAVSDAAHESGTSEHGGGLIDLSHCGRADDQWDVALPMLELGRNGVPTLDSIRAEVDGEEARVIVTASSHGVRLERSYALRSGRGRQSALWIRSRIERVADGPRFPVLGEMILHPSASLALFVPPGRYPEAARGFAQPSQEVDGLLSAASSFAALDRQVLIGDPALQPEIAYSVELVRARLERATGEREDLPFFSQSSESHELLGVAVRPFWIGNGRTLGWLQLAQLFLFMDLAKGDRIEVVRAIRVGKRADAESPQARRYRPLDVRGRIDDPAARIHVEDDAGRPFSFVRPEASGEYAFSAPPGRYQLRALASAGRSAQTQVEVPASPPTTFATPLRLGPASRVRLPRGQPMRLVFRGENGTPDPVFRDPLTGLRFADYAPPPSEASNDVSLAGVPSDPEFLEIAPGHYRVYATRGPEYDVREAHVEVPPRGGSIALAIDSPVKVLETPGWISADLHVHSGISNDSGLPVDERVRSFAAQGAEILVATEHDRIFDPAPRVRALGLGNRLRSVVGSEITSTAHSAVAPRTFGHANAFPLTPDPRAYRRGAIRANGRRLREAIAEVKGLGGERLFQLNHPRSDTGEDGDSSFFEHLSFGEGGLDRGAAPNAGRNAPLFQRDRASGLRDVDFDALELFNGPSMHAYRTIRADWLWLWLSGEPRTATANSDSHRLSQVVALPRTYVRQPDDRLEAFDDSRFVRALREGRALGTSGPWIDLDLGGAGIGETFRGTRAVLRVQVRAAPWVPVSTLRIWRGALVIDERTISAGEAIELPLEFERDDFVWVEVYGVPDETFRALAPGFPPLAFTNPIRIDADRDGRWIAPGVPEPIPPALAEPLSLGPDEAAR